jgi:hypothetical protein
MAVSAGQSSTPADCDVENCDVNAKMLGNLTIVIRMFGAGWRPRGLPRGLVLAAARLLLALAVICGAVQSGARYFYCDALGLSSSDPCAASAQSGGGCPLESVGPQSIDCCAIITLPAVPEGARAREQTVAPAGVVALLRATEYMGPNSLLRVEGFARTALRIERPPRPGGELRTQLMVFLT